MAGFAFVSRYPRHNADPISHSDPKTKSALCKAKKIGEFLYLSLASKRSLVSSPDERSIGLNH
jgi:hypothetical protein